MKRNLKTVSVAIPKKQFRQILDYLDKNADSGDEAPTMASFLREAITEFLSTQGYEEIKASFSARQGRPARRK